MPILESLRSRKTTDTKTRIAMFTDEEIRRKQEICDAPVVTESGECFVVKSVELYLDGKCAEVEKVTDVAVFAHQDAAYDFAARMTKTLIGSDDAESSRKLMYTVSVRHLDVN
ncbi:hypothetical protein [Dorea longicatena]|uniref:hypothetical protein n=1 Tax=Dorea longicatena TaxID=88431 RepID=UPI0032C00ABF